MARRNTKPPIASSHVFAEERLAGGYGPHGAKQDAEQQLRRVTMTCLLWEDIAYISGQHVADRIAELVPQVPGERVAAMACEARQQQKLRHVPLLLVREMVRHATHRPFVADTLAQVCKRPDELAEFLQLYWDTQAVKGKRTLAACVKKGLARAFTRFDEYQLAKYDKQDRKVKLRDVLFLSHAKPAESHGARWTRDERRGTEQVAPQLSAQEALWARLVTGQLAVPDTWEVGLSAAKSVEEKKAVWERLIAAEKLPAFAMLKNLRNMTEVGVSNALLRRAFADCRPDMLLPIDFLKAQTHAPDWTRELEDLMFRCTAQWPRLAGHTVFCVDVSGSMGTRLSRRSEFARMEAAAAMTVLAAEVCEHVTIYATAGSDAERKMATAKVTPVRGFALAKAITSLAQQLGGGGIFTRQLCEHLRCDQLEPPDRIVIFSDSQDCDLPGSGQPRPHGQRNYIVDVSCETHGVNYDGVWTAEVSGWSEQFLRFIHATEQESAGAGIAAVGTVAN